MILWTIKLWTTLRRAIAGRRYPAQLAWAVALGVLLGIIPHGNLLAIALLVVVLSLKINHAAAALTAIGVSFLAAKLDPVSHQVGNFVLIQPRVADAAAQAWRFPLVPWTDLNNTVVMGSFLIGVVALLPIFMLTYPIFRLFKPADEEAAEESLVDQRHIDQRHIDQRHTDQRQSDQRQPGAASSHPVELVRHPSPSGRTSPPSHHLSPNRTAAVATGDGQSPHQIYVQGQDGRIYPVARADSEPIEFFEIDRGHQAFRQPTHATETRIDVVRVAETKPEFNASQSTMPSNQAERAPSNSPQSGDGAQPMDEALNYLLRQLRDSQTRNVA